MDFRRQNLWAFGASVPSRRKKNNLPETSVSKLLKESTAFLCPCYSRKPVRFAGFLRNWQRLLQDQFRREKAAARCDDSSQFAKYCFPRRIEIKNAVYDCHINLSIIYRNTLSVSESEFDVFQTAFPGRISGAFQHDRTKIDTDNPSPTPN